MFTARKGDKMNKAYIALHTCASSRFDFVGRRGIPKEVLSDNAKTFKSVEVQEYIRSIGLKWNFNVEGAPPPPLVKWFLQATSKIC
jgi:hypothetical protein